MDKRNQSLEKEVELKEEETKKDQFDSILEKIKKMSEAIELHTDVKKAVESKQVEDSYLKYIENALEDKLFCDAKFDKIRSKVLLEVVCPELVNIEKLDIEKLDIEDIGSHYEEQENYIDKICTYENKFICLFGVNESNPEKVIKYKSRKFTRVDMIEAVKLQYTEGEKLDIYQYDEYYVVVQNDKVKVFSERKITSLVAVEETVFDKIKTKLMNLFSINIFSKKKYLPNISLVYETNPNRIEGFENKSKIDAKNRMRILLKKEREITRNTTI